MKTVDQAYAELGPANTFALHGVHCFGIGALPTDPATVPGRKTLWLSKTRKVTCASAADAKIHWDSVLRRHHDNGGMNRDLPSQSGYVCDADTGAVTHKLSTNGRLWALSYLGRSGEKLATQPLILA